jgi:transcriptional regulator with XRE-family HTH domain
MKLSEWFDQKVKDLEGDFEFRLERLIYRLTEKVAQEMDAKQLNRVQLAQKMSVSSAYVTKVLRGSPNFTLKTLLKLADALDQELVLSFEDKPRHKNVVAFNPQRAFTDSSASTIKPGIGQPPVPSTAWPLDEPDIAAGGGVNL